MGFIFSSISLLTTSFAEDENLIPSWIKNTAKFWVENEVSDRDFLNALQYLVKEGLLEVPNQNSQTSNMHLEQQKERIQETVPVIDGGVITCDPYGTKSLKVDVWIQNPFDKIVSIELVSLGVDINGEPVSLNVFTIRDILPGQKNMRLHTSMIMTELIHVDYKFKG